MINTDTDKINVIKRIDSICFNPKVFLHLKICVLMVSPALCENDKEVITLVSDKKKGMSRKKNWKVI